MSDNPYLDKQDGQLPRVTTEGLAKLEELVTDPTGNVYAIKDGISPVMAAAAMARLSRNPNDMRVVMLDEFVGRRGEEAALLHRVISQFGDDSVQQLVGVQLAVENASNLLTKLLEWGRFGAYLEQSTRYIFFDQKGEDGRYKYFVPTTLQGELLSEYQESMDTIFDMYSEMVRGIAEHQREQNPQGDSPRMAWMAATRAQACDAVRAVLPAATRSTVGIFGSAQAIDNLIMNLLSQPLEESRVVGLQLLNEVRKVVPEFFERTDIPERGGGTVAYKAETRQAISELATKLLPKPSPWSGEAVTLRNYWPDDEADLVDEMLFEASSLPLGSMIFPRTIENVDDVFRTYIGERLNRRHKPGRAFEIPHYEFEVVDEYGTFRDLQRHRVVDDMEWQQLTPFYGFSVPRPVQEADYETLYRNCFQVSQQLYERMVEAGHEVEAQYATLMGHRMRYRFVINARAAYHLIELRSAPAGHPGYRRIAQQMYECIRKVHPRIAAGMKFVGLDEDPALTRLAAEKAAYYKQKALEKR
jgi:thymidylate synthase ThyX